jgi:hypothetical protein
LLDSCVLDNSSNNYETHFPLSLRQYHFYELGYNKGTISRLTKKVNLDRKNLKGGKPKKLIAIDEKTIISQINIGKA